MKRYTLRLANTPTPEQRIQDQIEMINQFISTKGLATIRGLNEDYASKIEMHYNTMLRALGDLYQNFNPSNSKSIPISLNPLREAFQGFVNDPLCRNYTVQNIYKDINSKINELEEILTPYLAVSPGL